MVLDNFVRGMLEKDIDKAIQEIPSMVRTIFNMPVTSIFCFSCSVKGSERDFVAFSRLDFAAILPRSEFRRTCCSFSCSCSVNGFLYLQIRQICRILI